MKQDLEARCWPGTRADEEDMMNDDRYFDGGIGVNSEDIFGIHGELEFEDQTNFACRWEYTTEEDISGIPAVPQAQVSGDEHVLAGLGNLVEIHNNPTGDAEHFIEEYELSSEDPQVIGGDDDFTIFTENHYFSGP